MLTGWKTYIVAILIGLTAVALYMKWIDQALYEQIMTLLGALGLAAVRSAIK